MTASSKGVIWDFDGVLVSSDEIKWSMAWREAAKNAPLALFAAIRGIVQTNEGRRLSRHEVAGRALAVLSELGIAPRITRHELVRRYGDAVTAAIIKSGLRRGATRTLTRLQSAGIAQFLVSGTPQKDLEETIAALGLKRYFTEIHGGTSAEKPLRASAIKERFPSIRQWYAIGDQVGDIEVANAISGIFIGVRTENNSWEVGTTLFQTVSEEMLDGVLEIILE